jgi:sporulation protein YlmC with PRC-barrel domain
MSGKRERFKLGADVAATDGRCGHLTRVILEPVTESLTHLVVEPGHHKELARLVPVDLVVSVEDNLIRLNCTKMRFEQLDPAEDIGFLHGGTPTYYAGDMPLGHHRQPVFTDHVPLGEVAIRRGDPVEASDGRIGAVKGLVVNPDHQVTHLILREGHVWGRKQVAIPIGAAKRVGDEVRVDLTKDEIAALPPVGLSSRR